MTLRAADHPSRRHLVGATIGVLAMRPFAASAVAPAPMRIVSIGGAVTEILYELGLGERIVAVDTTSLHPPEAMRTKASVGYMRQLSAEGIVSVRPTLVIALEGAGPPDALKLVREAGSPVLMVAEDPTEAGVLARIATIAATVGRETEGRRLAQETGSRFAALSALRARIAKPAQALFVLSIQNGRVMVGGRNTTADGMLVLAGARNAAAAIDGYKAITEEAIIAAAPEVVIMMDNGPAGRPPANLFETPGLAQTPAARERRLVAMNGSYLLGFGPRTPEAARDLLLALHPGTKPE